MCQYKVWLRKMPLKARCRIFPDKKVWVHMYIPLLTHSNRSELQMPLWSLKLGSNRCHLQWHICKFLFIGTFIAIWIVILQGARAIHGSPISETSMVFKIFKSQWVNQWAMSCKFTIPCVFCQIPESERTLPTSWEEKLSPPYFLSLTAQRENTCSLCLPRMKSSNNNGNVSNSKY